MKKIIKPFLLGIIAALGALFLELFLYLIFPEQQTQHDYYNKITFFLLLVVALEEFFKILIIYKNSVDFVKRNIIFVSSFLIGAGFAITELLLKDYNQESFLSLGNLNIALVHILTASLAGYILSQKDSVSRIFLFKIWLLSFSIHLLYNISIIYFL